MIKATNSGVEVNGTRRELMVQLGMTLRAFHTENIISKEEALDLVRIAFMSSEEVDEEFEKISGHLIEKLGTLMELLEKTGKGNKDTKDDDSDPLDDIFGDLLK